MLIKLLKSHKLALYFFIIIIIIWSIIQILFYNYYFFDGIKVMGGASGRYLKLANNILAFNELKSKSGNYYGYGFIIAVIKFFLVNDKLTLYFLIFFQILVSFIAGITFFLLCSKFLNLYASILIFGMYMCYPLLQMWNFFVLTESLFLSLTIIFISIFLMNYKKYNFIYFLLASVIIATIRPQGWFLPLSISIFFLFNLKSLKQFIFYSLIFLCFTILSFSWINYMLKKQATADYESTPEFYEGWVMWTPDIEKCNSTQESFIIPYCYKTKKEIVNKYHTIAKKYGHISSMLLMTIQNPFLSVKLFFWRIFWELFKVRLEYNIIINIGLFLTLIPIYIFMFLGILKKQKYNNVDLFFLIYTIFTLGGIALTFADFSSRFSMLLLPFTFYYSSIGMIMFYKLLFLKETLDDKIKKL